MNLSLDNTQLLVVGTSGSAAKYGKDFFEKKKDEGYRILSYSGNSLVFLYDIDLRPDFFAFFDPFAYSMGLSHIGIDNKAWLNTTACIGYDYTSFNSLLNTNRTLNGSETFGFTDFLRNPESVNLYKSHPPGEVFKECYCKTPTPIQFDQTEDINLSEELYMIRNYGNELDKLTYYLLPLIFNFFTNLSRLELLGFGTFNYDRYSGASGSYGEYISAYDQILPHLKKIKINQKVDITLEEESYFKEVETIFN